MRSMTTTRQDTSNESTRLNERSTVELCQQRKGSQRDLLSFLLYRTRRLRVELQRQFERKGCENSHEVRGL